MDLKSHVPHTEYLIRLATREDLDAVYRITHDSLVAVGDIVPRQNGRLITYRQLDESPKTTVIVAEAQGEVVGTNSITLDGPDGLHTDFGFRRETDLIRSEGRRLSSSWRIATAPRFRNGKRLVQDLIRETFRVFLRSNQQTCLFVFPPRFERVYQLMLAARTVARGSVQVDDRELPAVLMRADIEQFPDTPILQRLTSGELN